MEKVSCSKCSAVYERTEFKLPVRDKDHANCEVCGEELESWNGSRVPSFRLMERPKDWPKK